MRRVIGAMLIWHVFRFNIETESFCFWYRAHRHDHTFIDFIAQSQVTAAIALADVGHIKDLSRRIPHMLQAITSFVQVDSRKRYGVVAPMVRISFKECKLGRRYVAFFTPSPHVTCIFIPTFPTAGHRFHAFDVDLIDNIGTNQKVKLLTHCIQNNIHFPPWVLAQSRC
jgi:hypothetical protein